MRAQRKTALSNERQIALLRAVGDEIYALAAGIVELGDMLSSPAAASADLQSFDLLGQRAFAHARLVLEIARLLDDGAPDWEASLHASIGSVPFEPDRRRLLAALGEVAEPPSVASGEMEWL